jgi:lipopolysaccharide biosynthesis glycosyltransferase
MNKISLTVTFDAKYIEPAIVTILDMAQFLPEDFDLSLVYIASPKESENSEAYAIIGESIKHKNISAIEIKRSEIFDTFNKLHFTNSILYKLILPQVINARYILNIDAGFLTGTNIGHMFEYFRNLVGSKDFRRSPIAAVCTAPETNLPASLMGLPHSSFYPAGGILLFNTECYRAGNVFGRLIEKYTLHKDQLLWAEQDLLCLTLSDFEIFNLQLHEEIFLEQLSVQSYVSDAASIAFESKFALYKITGSLKPWKYWVLDRNKEFYLKRRAQVLGGIDLRKYKLINDNRHEITNRDIYEAFLAIYEQKMIQNVCVS